MSANNEQDPLYFEACKVVCESGKTNITHLQRTLRLGYNRAARLIEALEAKGVVSSADKYGVRKLLKHDAADKAADETLAAHTDESMVESKL